MDWPVIAASVVLVGSLSYILIGNARRRGWLDNLPRPSEIGAKVPWIAGAAIASAGWLWPPLARGAAYMLGVIALLGFGTFYWFVWIAPFAHGRDRKARLMTWGGIVAILAALAVFSHPHSFARGIEMITGR